MDLICWRIYHSDEARLHMNPSGVHPIGPLDCPEFRDKALGLIKKGDAWIGDDLNTIPHLDGSGPSWSFRASEERIKEYKGEGGKLE